MARRSSQALLASILLLAASGAEAGVLTAATWTQVIEGFSINRTGAQLNITGLSTGTSIAVSLTYPALSTTFFLPKTPNGVPVPFDRAVMITLGGPQALTATPGMGGATMGVPGTVVIMDASHNTKGVNQSTYKVGNFNLAIVPLSIGQAGQTTSSLYLGIGNLHYRTVDFYAWTPGTLPFAGLTTHGFALPSVVAMGSFNLTASGGGTVTLVSPTKVRIDGDLTYRRTVSVSSLKLYFVPEPSTLLLLGAVGGMLLLRYSRARR